MTDTTMNSEGLGEYLTQVFDGHRITQRPTDGYINAIEMCKAKKGKRFANWYRNKDTREFLDALSAEIGNPAVGLVESTAGGTEAKGGTWIHPDVAIHLAMWLDARCAVQVGRWASRFMCGDQTLADVHRGPRTSAVVPAAHQVACDTETGGSKRARETPTTGTLSTKCARTQDILVSSEWLTSYIDRQWDALGDAESHRPYRMVYFLRPGGTPEVKVGFSRDPLTRLRRLQCGNAFDLHLEHQVPTERYIALERWIHEYLTANGRHIRGEWFDLAIGTDCGTIVDDATKRKSEYSDHGTPALAPVS